MLILNSVTTYLRTEIKKCLKSVLVENLIYLCSSQQLLHFTSSKTERGAWSSYILEVKISNHLEQNYSVPFSS